MLVWGIAPRLPPPPTVSPTIPPPPTVFGNFHSTPNQLGGAVSGLDLKGADVVENIVVSVDVDLQGQPTHVCQEFGVLGD